MQKKSLCLAVLAGLLLAGCDEDPQAFWTQDVCNQRIEADVVNFEDYQEKYAKDKIEMEKDIRTGNTARAEINKKNMQSRKDAAKTLLHFIDTNIAKFCRLDALRPDLQESLSEARAFANDTESAASASPEGMPALRVSSIKSTFVPYQMDQFGRCEGPILDLVITVTNNGGDFPRPVDLETYTERAQRQAAELDYFTMRGQIDFGGDMKKNIEATIKGDAGTLKAGASLDIPIKVKVEYNQTHAKVTGNVSMHAFLEHTPGTEYQTEIDIPVWDIYTVSHQAVGSKDQDDGRYYIITKGTVTNLGKSPTPGPVEASFIVQDADTGRHIIGWTGKTSGPVSGNVDIYEKTLSNLELPKKIKVQSTVIPLCPDGTAGNLADGDAKNNARELRQEGAAAASST